MNEKEKKILFLILDADGCIYNSLYDFLYYYLIDNYALFLLASSESKHSDTVKKEKIKRDVNNIIQELNEIILYEEDDIKIQFKNKDKMGFDAAFKYLINSIYDKYFSVEYREAADYEIKDDLKDLKEQFRKCIDKLGKSGIALSNAILYLSNQALFKEIIDRFQKEHFTKLIVMSGSNRQSIRLDKFNSECNQTGLFSIDILALVDLFNELTDKNICFFDGFMMADVFGNLKTGQSHQKILDEEVSVLNTKIYKAQHADYIFDVKKLTLCYAMLHHIATKYPHCTKTVAFFDDRKDIHRALTSKLVAHPDLLPNLQFECWYYYGLLPKNKHLRISELDYIEKGSVFKINGTGDKDFNFCENVKKIVKMCGGNVNEKRTVIDACAQLDIERFKAHRITTRGSNTLGTHRFFEHRKLAKSDPASTSAPSLLYIEDFAGKLKIH